MSHQFHYIEPSSVSEAVEAYKKAENAQFLAGGQTLLPTIKQRLALPELVISLAKIRALDSITVTTDSVKIGAMATHASIARNAEISAAVPGLQTLASHVGDPAVRNLGTIGGSVANNDPAACYPAACVALDATIVTSDQRRLAAKDFFLGAFETALEPGELVTEIVLAVPKKSVYMKFPQPASLFAMVGVFLAQHADGLRIAVTGAGQEGVFRCHALESALSASLTAEAVRKTDLSDLEDTLIADIHASPAYRLALIKELTVRALAAL